jgi:plastocyanin
MPPTEPEPNQPAPTPPQAPTPRTPYGWGNRNMAMVSLFILVLLVIVVGYFSFASKPKSSVNNNTSPTEPATIAPASVDIANSGFTPTTIHVKVGQAVVWTNTDSSSHSIASDNPKPLFDSQSLSQNDTFSYVFNKAGTYPYHDNANTRLAGIVIVQ